MGLCFQANPVLFDSINRWVMYSRPLRSLDLSRHRPVVDGPGPTWARVGRAPFKRLDELCEGESVFSILALIALPLLVLNLVVGVLFHPLKSAGSVGGSVSTGVGWGVLLLVVGVFLAFRALLLAWRCHRVSIAQMNQLHEWMSSYPSVGLAASFWMRPGLILHQGDFRAIRRAVNLQRRQLGLPLLSRPAPTAPAWLLGWMNWLFHRLSTASAKTNALAAQIGQPLVLWGEALRENKRWVVDNALAVPSASSPVATLSTKDQKRLQGLARWRTGLEQAASVSASDEVKDTWCRLIHHVAPVPSLQSVEGQSLASGWLVTSLWSALKKGMVLTMILGVAGQVAAMQVRALELPAQGQASTTVGNWVVGAIHFFAPLPEHALTVGATLVALVLVCHLPLLIPLWTLRTVWWRLPLSPAGRARLDEIVSRLPMLRPSFLVMGKEGLTQADLAFARRAANALRHVKRHRETMEEMERRAQALENLPAMAQYRARQLATKLGASLVDPTPTRPKPRF